MSNFTNYFTDATFWVGAASVIFFMSTYFLLKKSIGSLLINKIKEVKHILDESAREKAEAEELVQALRIREQNLDKEIRDIIHQANLTAQNITQQAKSDIENTINDKTAQAMRKLDSYESSLMQQLKISAIEIAIQTVHDLIKKHSKQEIPQDLMKKIYEDLKKIH